MPKISDPVYPSQTGAQVANGDLMYIVDVGTPNISEKITVNELAQAPQFSSRYVSLTNETTRWIDAPSMHVTFGSAVIGNPALSSGIAAAWLMDASALEIVASSIVIPATWATFNISLYWTNNASSSGDVRWQMQGQFAGDTDAVEAGSGWSFDPGPTNIAAPTTAGVIKVSQIGGTVTNTSTKPFFFMVARQAANAADTLANDAGIYGVLFTKVT